MLNVVHKENGYQASYCRWTSSFAGGAKYITVLLYRCNIRAGALAHDVNLCFIDAKLRCLVKQVM